jgi:hypothetical protein
MSVTDLQVLNTGKHDDRESEVLAVVVIKNSMTSSGLKPADYEM